MQINHPDKGNRLTEPADTVIIIPSLNSPLIDRVVAAINQQEQIGRIAEIVVVGKDEAGLLTTNERVRLLDTGEPILPGAARNLGIQATTAALLIFLDSDCIPQPGWLAAHLAAHAAGYLIVGGSILAQGENYWALSYNLSMFHEYLSGRPDEPRSLLPTLNLSVARRVIDKVGLLNEALPRSQDMEWTTRMKAAGFQPYFWPTAVVDHQHNRLTRQQVWQDCLRSGRYARQVRLEYGRTLQTPYLLRFRRTLRLLAPLVAGVVTMQVVRQQPTLFRRHWTTLPAVYLTKLAWCWGASQTV
jgi:GT2 family glycosyltransferase